MAEQSKRVSTTLGHGGCLALLFGIVFVFFCPTKEFSSLPALQATSLACLF